ncbi:MAG: FAD/NAD(P)-binding protein [Isosphaeraceae bacterium]
MSNLLAFAPVSPWKPHPVTIDEIRQEVPGIATYQMSLLDPARASNFRFAPGQFNMVYVPGVGESAISLSSDPGDSVLEHTIRIAGNVTRALARKKVGDQVAIRGPFGSSWPMDACTGRDLVIACGGVGLAPLRPAICHIITHRADYGRVFLLYGARTPGDLLFAKEYPDWREHDIEVEVTVDIGDPDWRGNMGVVPVLFYRLRLNPAKTAILTCGPEIMIRFVIFEALARKIPADRIFLSMERNMNCAIGHCGHCQLGPAFICKDGPVFSYRQMEPYMHLEDF